MEVSPNGHLIFYKSTKGGGEKVVHVQATGTFKTCEILSALDGYPSNALPLQDAGK